MYCKPTHSWWSPELCTANKRLFYKKSLLRIKHPATLQVSFIVEIHRTNLASVMQIFGRKLFSAFQFDHCYSPDLTTKHSSTEIIWLQQQPSSPRGYGPCWKGWITVSQYPTSKLMLHYYLQLSLSTQLQHTWIFLNQRLYIFIRRGTKEHPEVNVNEESRKAEQERSPRLNNQVQAP